MGCAISRIQELEVDSTQQEKAESSDSSGPTGGSLSDVRAGHTMVASTDSLAADAFGWDDLLRRKGKELPAYFAKAAARKLGSPKWREVRHKEVKVG